MTPKNVHSRAYHTVLRQCLAEGYDRDVALEPIVYHICRIIDQHMHTYLSLQSRHTISICNLDCAS